MSNTPPYHRQDTSAAQPVTRKRANACANPQEMFEPMSKASKTSRSASPHSPTISGSGQRGGGGGVKEGGRVSEASGRGEAALGCGDHWDVFWTGAVPTLRSKSGRERDIEIFPEHNVYNGWFSHLFG